MSQRTKVENLKKFAGQPSALNPQLQAVLGNLDVQLDDELARYRRKKRSEAQAPQPSSHRSSRPGTQKNLELVVTPLPGKVASTEAVEGLNGDRTEQETSPSQMDRAASGTPLSPQAALPQPLDDGKEQPNDYLESSEKLLVSLDDKSVKNIPNQSRSRRRRRRSLKSMLSPLTVGVSLLFVLMLGTIAHVFTGKAGDRQPVTTAVNSDSSQTETPLPEVPRSPNLADKEFVPLDLDTLGTLSGNSPKPTPIRTVPSASSPVPIENVTTTPATTSPNYPSLENINTAILPQSVQDKPRSSATASNNAESNTSASANNAPEASTATTSPTTSPAPPATTPTPVTQTPETSAQPTVSAQSFPTFFYVLIDYNNDDSLFIARQVVPDAYLREFPVGVKIQMAAFDDAASAQQMANYLKEQGLAAQVYQP